VSPAAGARLRAALAILLLAYGAYYIARPGHYGLLDHVDLPIHETGHLVFGPLGEFAAALGGTLFQLIIPAAFVAYFWRRDRFAAGVALWWVAQNLWNISVYVGDARAEELPLVGGGEHDWAYLLGELGWLERDQAIGQLVRAAGMLAFLAAMMLCFANLRTPAAERA
jgi:hypothetical protein